MTREQDHEREHDHTVDRVPVPDSSVPGRASRSAAMSAPAIPLVSGILMRRGTAGAVSDDANASVESALSSGGGRGLPNELRSKFESSLDTDLSAVRIHEGTESQAAASAVAAKAFTVGNDIHFGAGHYDPSSQHGQHLIAHEVAHTVQQRGGTPVRQHKLEVSHPGDTFEVAADHAADAMVAGSPVSLGGASIGLAREPSEGETVLKGAQSMTKNGDRSFKSGSQGFSLGQGKGSITFGPDGLTGSLKLGSADLGVGKKIDPPPVTIPIGGAGGVMLKVGGAVTLSANASVSANGAAPKDGVLTATISGSGSVGLKAAGTVMPSVYAGVPLANLHAGGRLELAASTSTAVRVSGTVTLKDNGNGPPVATGSVKLTVEPQADITATGAIVVGYNAVVTSGELWEHEVGSLDIAKASATCVATYDFATGATSTEGTDTKLTFLPLDLGSSKKVKKFKPVAAAMAAAAKAKIEAKKQEMADAKANVKQHELEHGVDNEHQQTHNVPPQLQPQDCTDPKELEPPPSTEVAPQQHARPKWLPE